VSTVLDIAGLHVRFAAAHPVRGISLQVAAGQTHGLVGESGSGKSLSALAVMGLLPRGAVRSADHILFDGAHITALHERAMAKLRGDRMAMIFQEPMTSLNPAYTVGSQMTEVLRRHRGLRQDAAVERSAAMLARVGISAASMRLGQFPHQLSGGLRQRVMIAMALLCEPKLLIADEPTTALDVTVQAQILRLLATLQREFGLAVLLITHDLGVVARVAQQVSVMYAGEIVEQAPVAELFARPTHPYTRGLLASIPVPGKVRRGERLGSIRGTVPNIAPGFSGCAFRDRCDHAIAACAEMAPLREAGPGHAYRCRLDPLWRDAA
jgi:peptide/nickel transport system ATP-binding protein